MSIHPTAIVSDEARISSEAEVGPFCVITGNVEIGAHTTVDSHARIGSRFGTVTIGEHNYIQSGAVLGGAPQDLGYERDAGTALLIGDRNRIGEYASVHLGTRKGGGTTRIGHRNLIMAYAHIGHDCELEDDVVITNATQLAGHVKVEHHALLSGLSGVTQFCRLGAYSFLTAGSHANKDIPPYTIAEGHWAAPRAPNRVALKRAGFGAAERKSIESALKLLFKRSLTMDEVIEAISAEGGGAAVEHLIEFLRTSKRGVARA